MKNNTKEYNQYTSEYIILFNEYKRAVSLFKITGEKCKYSNIYLHLHDLFNSLEKKSTNFLDITTDYYYKNEHIYIKKELYTRIPNNYYAVKDKIRVHIISELLDELSECYNLRFIEVFYLTNYELFIFLDCEYMDDNEFVFEWF